MNIFFTRQTFNKTERLKSRKLIALLLTKGKREREYPLIMYWLAHHLSSPYPAQVAISVPKRLFKSAVKRNLLKRRIREGYRKNKANFHINSVHGKKNIILFFIYQSKEIIDYITIENAITTLLAKIEKNVS